MGAPYYVIHSPTQWLDTWVVSTFLVIVNSTAVNMGVNGLIEKPDDFFPKALPTARNDLLVSLFMD